MDLLGFNSDADLAGPKRSDMQPTSASDAQVKIRLNREVRDELKVAAAINRRTLMREIEFRVMQSLAKERAQPQGAQQ